MKVISQMITYLEEQNILTDKQRQYLIEHGFLSPYPQNPLDIRVSALPNAQPEEWESESTGRPPHSKRSTKKDTKALCHWLETQIPGWETGVLTGLFKVAQQLATPTDFKTACLTIRESESTQLRQCLKSGFQKQSPSLAVLWDAMVMETYLLVPGQKNTIVRTYHQMLKAENQNFNWLISHEAVAWVYEVKQAQERLLSECGLLFAEEPSGFARELKTSKGGYLRYWTFVILYNALYQPRDTVSTYHLHPMLERDTWQKAWYWALKMHPDSVVSFLSEFMECSPNQLVEMPSQEHHFILSHKTLYCPPEWD